MSCLYSIHISENCAEITFHRLDHILTSLLIFLICILFYDGLKNIRKDLVMLINVTICVKIFYKWKKLLVQLLIDSIDSTLVIHCYLKIVLRPSSLTSQEE